jgi:hypothetical protein
MMINPESKAPVNFSKWTPDQFDRLAADVQAEQNRRNQMLDLETIIEDELQQAKRRILNRLADQTNAD